MKLLFDQNVSYKLINLLKEEFPGSSHVRLVSLASASDVTVWDFAKKENFVIVTHDVDFYELGLLRGAPPKVIWLRCGNQPTLFLATLFKKNLEALNEFSKSKEKICLEILSL